MERPVVVEDDEFGEYLVGLMELLLSSSTGPFDIQQTHRRRYVVVATSPQEQFVASFTRRPDAELFVRTAMGLQNVVTVFAEIRSRHYDDGTGLCAECSKPFACETRLAVLRLAGVRAAAG